MDQVDENPSEINRKRKLQPGLLILPLPKHQCWDRGPIHSSTFNKHSEEDDTSEVATKGKVDMGDGDGNGNDGSRLESEKDSNSHVKNSDSSMSSYGVDSWETESASIANGHSSLSATYGCANLENSSYPLDSMMMLDKQDGKGNLVLGLQDVIPLCRDSQLRVQQILEDHLLQLNHADHICSEEGKDSIDQCHDDETQDIFYSNGGPSANFVLSSGRWIINGEAQHSTRRPTIDQEFEQYFSMLML